MVVVLAMCVAALAAMSAQLRCIDAAREAARLAARGDQHAAVDVARRVAPPGARVQLRRDGPVMVATVTSNASLLPGLVVSATELSVVEDTG